MRMTAQHDLSPWGREAQPRKADHMHKHSRSTVLGLAVLGLALIAAPAYAANLFTVNQSDQQGAEGSKLFVPVFLSSTDTDGVLGSKATGVDKVYIPYLGSMTPCAALVGGTSGIGDPNVEQAETDGCNRWGAASLKAWANGLYYNPSKTLGSHI